ncbi:hypothetical protein GO755_00695 [Spirosoma sp. HMF4905]|uniref:Uncharacterized protein n=1 Tax=Spirosoma arboris TaxID=2682092 RepID=A0A7K1S3Y9_9BACT|nr:hypothetical protein [Spirosoma arboris]MVM28529.1 hypothetical protein [Spirosoma arboris]
MKTSKWSNDLALLNQIASMLRLADSVLKRTIEHSQAQGYTEHLEEHRARLAEVEEKLIEVNEELQGLCLLHEAAILTGNYTESRPG